MGALLVLLLLCQPAQAQRATWRQATDAELASLLPSRAAVEREHIETEMRTASGIVNNHGRYIAGVVLLTAGYSADGKYSHYLIVQVPMRVGRVSLRPGEYVFGWTRSSPMTASSSTSTKPPPARCSAPLKPTAWLAPAVSRASTSGRHRRKASSRSAASAFRTKSAKTRPPLPPS